MPEYDVILLSLLVFLPMLFALGLLCVPRRYEGFMLWWSLTGTAATLGLAIAIFILYQANVLDFHMRGKEGTPDERLSRLNLSLERRIWKMDNSYGEPEQFSSSDWVCRYSWIRRFSIDYYLGIDGISLPLVLLTALLSFLAMLASFGIQRPQGKDRFIRGYCLLFLLLETGMLGTFVALDFFLFYVFWELMLLPMYFLIGVWGGPRREYAAIKFFLYTLLGSVLILIALLGFYFTNLRDFVAPQVVERSAARLKGDLPYLSIEEARQMVKVNTFDLIALSRAGTAALQYLGNDHDIKAVTAAPALQEARRSLAELQQQPKADAQAIAAAQKRVEQLEAGLQQRLESEWFFTPGFQLTLFLLLMVGFCIKVPVFPFHTWLPDAHVEAPTPISMILAGVLLKMGGYGILRIAYPICPFAAEQLALWIALFGVINIVYGAFAAMAQTDFKKLVAYSSVSHMGYVLLGIAVWSTPENVTSWSLGMNGAMFQMIAHGITSAGMFFLVGVIYERAHHRNLDHFRGLYEPMPLYGGLSAIIFFAAMGLPGMCGFIGEVMVVLSVWKFAPGGQEWVGITLSILTALTAVLTAGYILWTLQRVFMGVNPHTSRYPDISAWELLPVMPLVILAILLGVLPQYLLFNWMEPSVTHLVDTLVRYRG
jgi:NADH-quinone oxidoreductase subunit M